MAKKNSVRAALIQQPPEFLNLRESVAKLSDLARECAAEGAEIIVFPETWLPGYPIWLDDAPEAALWEHQPAKRLFGYLFENAVAIEAEEVRTLCGIAQETHAYLVVGIHEREGASLYNTTLYISPDGSFKKHRKLTPTYTERLVWAVGDGSTLNVVETPYGTLGGLICWEHWMPLARAAMHAKHEVIHVAQYPTVHERHQIASRQYAFEGQCFVLASGCVMSKTNALEGFDSLGTDDTEVRALLESMRSEELMRGGSAVISPDISYVAEPLFDDPATVYAELDLAKVYQGRLLMDTDGHYSRPDVFNLTVNTKQNRNVIFSDDE